MFVLTNAPKGALNSWTSDPIEMSGLTLWSAPCFFLFFWPHACSHLTCFILSPQKDCLNQHTYMHTQAHTHTLFFYQLFRYCQAVTPFLDMSVFSRRQTSPGPGLRRWRLCQRSQSNSGIFPKKVIVARLGPAQWNCRPCFGLWSRGTRLAEHALKFWLRLVCLNISLFLLWPPPTPPYHDTFNHHDTALIFLLSPIILKRTVSMRLLKLLYCTFL